jgi:hypothetical protein
MHCLAFIAREKSREPAPKGFSWGEGFRCSCGEQYGFYVPDALASGLQQKYRDIARARVHRSHPHHAIRFEIEVT